MINFDLIIIGAGPAGLMAAIAAASKGAAVCVLEKNKLPGRKLLLAGGGQCNVTHAGDVDELIRHYADKGRFVRPAIFGFNNVDLMEFFESRGLAMTEREDGKVFPKTLNSQDVLKLLIEECRNNKVELLFEAQVKKIVEIKGNFNVQANNEKYVSQSLIIATGGKSYPQTGSTGDGYSFAEQFGHKIADLAPALTNVIVKNFKFAECAGISLKNIALTFWRGNKKIHQSTGDVLFTHDGLSGPAILDASRHLKAGDAIKLTLTDEQIENELLNEIQTSGRKALKNVLRKFDLPERLIVKIFEINKIPQELKMSEVNKQTRLLIVDNLTALTFEVKNSGDFNQAMATRGGVLTTEINPRTMESKLVENLFFAGEVIDVDADTGGYNLQWAFSSGFLAGRGSLRKVEKV
jgi:predicted Rossmann fold flavoprotein